MSQDAYHSGTMAAAREAGMYGVPAIASSWSSFDGEGMEISVDATVGLVEAALAVLPDIPANLNRPHIDINQPHLTSWPKQSARLWGDDPITALRNAFAAGEMFLNLNVPRGWSGKYSSTRLGMRWYRNAIGLSDDTSTFQLGGSRIDIDKLEIEALIRCGAMDDLEHSRPEMLWILKVFLKIEKALSLIFLSVLIIMEFGKNNFINPIQ